MRVKYKSGEIFCATDSFHLELTQRLYIRLVTGIRHLPNEERLQRLGIRSLQRRRLQVSLITAFKIFIGILDVDRNFFSPSQLSWPHKIFHGTSHCRRKGSDFSVRVVKNLPASVETAPSVEIFKKRFGESLDTSLPASSSRHPLAVLSLYATVLPVWFPQVCRGLLLTIINHDYIPIKYT